MDELSDNRMCVFFLVFMFIAIIFVFSILNVHFQFKIEGKFFLVTSIHFFHGSSENWMFHQDDITFLIFTSLC